MRGDRESDNEVWLRLTFSTLGVVVTAYVFTVMRVNENLLTAIAILLFAGWLLGPIDRISAWLWLGVGVLLATGIYARPLDVPNHHWMMTYLSLATAWCLLTRPTHDEQIALLVSHARWFLVVLMAFATTQKLLQPNFMNGSYIGFEMARGGFGGPLFKLVPGVGEAMVSNADAISTWHDTPDPKPLQLAAPFPLFRSVTLAFTWSILAMEAWLALAFFRFPRHTITHLSLIAFGAALTILRQEFTFISVVCTLGLMSCGPKQPVMRTVYAALAVVTAASVLKTLNH